MLERLKKKWEVSTWQAIVILVVFACTGFTVMFLKEPVLSLIADKEERSIWFTVIYYILILPVYNVVLLGYGFIFGQFPFFWKFEKRMFSRMTGNKKANSN
ncbi:DUF6787 family protein [Fulvivirga sp.]|uniref:DUF6787 family protein n=1 Tax=Fulvivirga sp. TaxID=1931237 RepID=UPI0032EE9EFC